MTALLIVFGIAGHTVVAADIGLVQSATLALFFAFSANARNLILADSSGLLANRLFETRLVLLLPLALTAYFISIFVSSVVASLAFVLVLRRGCEWLGELALAEHERMGARTFSLRVSMLECIAFSVCVLLPLLFGVSVAASALPWAFTPLIAIWGSGLSLFKNRGHFPIRCLLPHFGSTSIIGISAYIFRLSITLLVGKTVAGSLFTAFAIGGTIPTIYGQALAPTLNHSKPDSRLIKWLLVIPVILALLGAGITAIVVVNPLFFQAFDGLTMFWLSLGLSIGGGAMMCFAVGIRARLIHQTKGSEVFGPDLLANLLIAMSVPFVFYIFGSHALAGLYALSGFLSLVFIFGAGRLWNWPRNNINKVLSGVAILVLLPVFFQISRGLFRDNAFVYETAGSILILPLPMSVAGLFIGIALLANYANATWTLITVFFSGLLFVLTSLVVSQENPAEQGAKLVLVAQFLLPMFALILGEMYGATTNKQIFETCSLWLLLLVVPLQLLCSWLQGFLILFPSLYLFSIYQHLQYFPSVVVSLSFITTVFLWRNGTWKYWSFLLLLPLLFVYAVASRSATALGGLLLGMVVLMIAQRHANRLRHSIVVAILVSILFAVFYGFLSRSELVSKFQIIAPSTPQGLVVPSAPQSLTDRMEHWRFYAGGLIESPAALWFGHASPPDRQKHPSAHNYWLDALYNFGAIALAPLILLLLLTLHALWKWRSKIIMSPVLLGTTMAVIYLLLAENMLKVGMRQPYPGIITFFIWGLLIARLRALTDEGSKDHLL